MSTRAAGGPKREKATRSEEHPIANAAARRAYLPVLYNDRRIAEPRASRIPIPGRDDIATELWMGGADSLYGEHVGPEDLRDAWVVDLAGDMPEAHQAACTYWQSRVFADMEAVPQQYDRLAALARSIAAGLSGDALDTEAGHPPATPARLYIMCQ